jgi:hypothetical protein
MTTCGVIWVLEVFSIPLKEEMKSSVSGRKRPQKPHKPRASGYRVPLAADSNQSRVEFVTFYAETVDALLGLRDVGRDVLRASGRHADFNPKDMGIILRCSEIEVASRFDPIVFSYLNRDRLPDGWINISDEDAVTPEEPGTLPS